MPRLIPIAVLALTLASPAVAAVFIPGDVGSPFNDTIPQQRPSTWTGHTVPLGDGLTHTQLWDGRGNRQTCITIPLGDGMSSVQCR